jgi:Domain of unknown function (DUF222)
MIKDSDAVDADVGADVGGCRASPHEAGVDFAIRHGRGSPMGSFRDPACADAGSGSEARHGGHADDGGVARAAGRAESRVRDARAGRSADEPGAVRADACGRCGHAPDRATPALLVATGQLLPVSDVHRLARTSTLVRMVIDADGQVLDMGRRARLATPAQRRAILARYATCWIDGCPLPAHLCQIDHIDNWSEGGLTDLAKLGPACQFHNRHRYQHPDRYRRRPTGKDRWTFTYTARR